MKRIIFTSLIMLLMSTSVFAKQISFNIINKMNHPIRYEIMSCYGIDFDDSQDSLFDVNEGENATVTYPVKSKTRHQPILLLEIEDISYTADNNIHYTDYVINVYFSEQSGGDVMQTRFELLSQNNNDGHLVFDNNNATITLK